MVGLTEFSPPGSKPTMSPETLGMCGVRREQEKKVSHLQFLCCHNKQIPSMCAVTPGLGGAMTRGGSLLGQLCGAPRI